MAATHCAIINSECLGFTLSSEINGLDLFDSGEGVLNRHRDTHHSCDETSFIGAFTEINVLGPFLVNPFTGQHVPFTVLLNCH